ncbi:MAG: hypothetical protein HY700_14265 [Gemmatimonadetes bacterium]|nr:hypothetical protein [Gemmatimonadota bacterium]
MSTFRPLPPRPSLEFERKEAKALLRRLRARDPDALARARERHPAITASPKLADAQLVIAREYGFTSWPRLVRYFEDVERQRQSPQAIPTDRRDHADQRVRSLITAHGARRTEAGRAVAAFLPRCYGMRVADVFDVALTEDEARLVVARQVGFSSWTDLLARTITRAEAAARQWEMTPRRMAAKAMEALDLGTLQRVVAEHPEVLHPSDYEAAKGGNLMAFAIAWERKHGREAMRPIMDWLATLGLDLQRELNVQLCGRMKMKPETVRDLLDRGADPNWVAPNGVPVLEHALIRYWNAEAVDVLAQRAVPRQALWIAAGLGDVEGVRRFLDRDGRPTRAARRLRPPFDLVFAAGALSHPEPDDEEILLEAFSVAMLNGRTAVLEYMLAHGTPINTLAFGSPIILTAVGNAWVPVVECLVRGGADLDLRGWHPQQSAREMARECFEQMPENADRRRIVELCGMDPDVILAERDARPLPPPGVDPRLKEALELAGDDAARLGQSDIRPENLLFGLLRSGGPPLFFFTQVSRMDLERFYADVADRVRPPEDRVDHPPLALHSDAQATIQTAIALAAGRRREMVGGHHLLYALTQAGHGAAADLLARYGASVATLNVELERAL